MTTVTDCSASLRLAPGLPADARPAAAAPAIVKIDVFRDRSAVEQAWTELEAIAPASFYQTRAFLIPWIETLGAMRRIAPLFILGSDAQARPVALICLGIEKHGPFRIASFLGGKESNFNLGLFRPDARLTGADLRALLRGAAKALGADAPHVFALVNQPLTWEDVANPLALLPHQASPSFAYGTKLGAKGDAFVAGKLSKDTRKKLRKKEARLAEIGAINAIVNDTQPSAQAIVDAFLDQKIARSEAQAYDANFATPAMRSFLERLSLPRDNAAAPVELYALACGDKIVATYAGAAHRNHFSCLVNSFDTDAEIAKSSPGDLLLMRLVAAQCDKGRTGFDLGIGEARYKAAYCDVVIPLFDTILPVGMMGQLYAAVAANGLKLKRMIKQNPQVFARLKRLRQLIGRPAQR